MPQQPAVYYYQMPPHHEGPKVKDPDIFTGKDPTKLPTFLGQCAMAFLAKSSQFQNDRDRIIFVASYLQDSALAWWLLCMVKDPPDLITQDWNLFTTLLQTLYSAHNAENTAVVSIEALSMRDDTTVTQYIVEFQTHTPYTGWNDAALKAMFWKHLLERIKSAFLTIGKPATFDLMI
jgi:hypothetical protein